MVTVWVIRITNLLTKSPDPPRRLGVQGSTRGQSTSFSYTSQKAQVRIAFGRILK